MVIFDTQTKKLMRTIDDYNFEDKKALIRVDFNVPLDKEFNVTDTSRIEAAKPSILKVLEDGGSAVLMSHLGQAQRAAQRRNVTKAYL